MSKIVIDARKDSSRLSLKELFLYKDLFLVLAYRDFKVRYAQTYLGFLWAFIQPVAFLGVFTLVFKKAIGVETGDVPYPLFVLAGMIIWSYFSYVISESGNSIIGEQELIKKIYFPRIIIPLSKSLVGIVDFLIATLLVIALILFYESPLTKTVLLFPFFVFCGTMAALGIGIWVSALSIKYRDFQHILPFLLQIGLYISPVAYPSSLVVSDANKVLKVLYYLNPIAGVIEGVRWSLFTASHLDPYFSISIATGFILLISGRYYFMRVESTMADIV